MPPQSPFTIQNVSVRTSRSDFVETAVDDETYEDARATTGGSPTDIASQFNDNYQTKGLQPSVGGRPTISYKKGSIQPNQITTSNLPVKKKRVGTPTKTSGVVGDVAAPRRMSKKQLLSKIDPTRTTSSVVAVATVSRVNWFILAWAIPLWLFVQIPLALVALGGLGLAAGSEVALDSLFGGVVGSFINTIFSGVSSVVSFLFGTSVDLNPINAIRDFGMTTMVVLHVSAYFIGIITLCAMAFLYTFSGIPCFFGNWAGAKISFFIFALAGYFFPVSNLLPWFMLWGIVVWLSQIKASE
jgi:hypothetical protein